MFQLQPSLYFIVNSTWNLKKMSMKSNNLHVALDDNQLHHLFRVSGFKEALLGVTILPSGRHACFPMMLLLEQSDSGWMTHTDIQDNKQILSLLWVNWVIYLYHVLLFPDFLASTGATYVVMYHWYWSSHFFTQPIKILSIYASICRFWAIWYIVTSYNTMHVAERHFLAGSIRLWKFFTTLPEGTRLLDFWVHYPTLPYPKLKNHYPSGPDDRYIKEQDKHEKEIKISLRQLVVF